METRRTFLQKTAAAGIAGIVASGTAPAFAKERTPKSGVTLEDAWKLHRKCLIIDGHNDTPVQRVADKEYPFNWMKNDMKYQTDIPRMKGNGQQYAAFMIVGNGLIANLWVTAERVMKSIEDNPKDIMLVLNSADAVRAGKAGKVGVILSIEGAAKWLEGRIETLHLLHRLGIRLVGITHGEGGEKVPNALQGAPSIYRACTPEERVNDRKNTVGLTPFGFEVLKAENELGIVPDMSHINDKAFFDVMERSTTPPIMSHTAVFSLCNHGRCMTDDQIKAIAAKGGAMGISLVPQFIDADPKKATIDRVVDHLCYVADLVGIDTVAFGSDYDGGVPEPIIPEVSQLVKLTQAMMSRGFTDDEIRKIWSGNYLRVLQKTIDKTGK
jgi:membrane dipeptidase